MSGHWNNVKDGLPRAGQHVLVRVEWNDAVNYFEDRHNGHAWMQAMDSGVTAWCELPRQDGGWGTQMRIAQNRIDDHETRIHRMETQMAHYGISNA